MIFFLFSWECLQKCMDIDFSPIFFNAAFIHLDIDECEYGDDDCRQVCNNTFGSYECSCYSGYYLRSDGQSCEGEQGCM